MHPMKLQTEPSLYRKHNLRCLLLAALLVCFATNAGAQEKSTSEPAGDLWGNVEEMVVFGSEAYGGLTEATVSVTSFDAADIQAIGASDVSDVAKFTPNLEIRTAGSTSSTFFIRGVGLNDFAANASGSVAVYVDEAPKNLPAIQLGQLFDLEGIEIQKGPQGSGPGRNASAGAIRIATKKPTGELGGFLRIDYGNYQFIDVEGAIESPIVADTLSVRTAFRLTQRDGLVKNRCAGFTQSEIDAAQGRVCGSLQPGNGITPFLADHLNDQDKWSVRVSMLYEPPIDDMEWTLTFTNSRVDQLGTVGQHIGAFPSFGGSDRAQYIQPEIGIESRQINDSLNIPSRRDCRRASDPAACSNERDRLTLLAGNILSERLGERPLDLEPFEGDYNKPGYERQTHWGFLLRGDWQLGPVKIESITGFDRYDRERLIDADYSPNTFFEFDIEDDAWQFNQDLRVSGEFESIPVAWHAGAFILEEELDFSQVTLARAPLTPLTQSYVQSTTSLGVFAEFDWQIFEDITLEAGARYNWEQKKFEADIIRGSAPGTEQCIPDSAGVIPPCTRTDTFDHPTGTITMRYEFDELRTFYAKYSHGWKGSQYNVRDGVFRGLVTDVADPEIIDAFEIGFSGSWLDDRVLIEGAIFSYEYQDYQVFTFTNDVSSIPQRVVLNADDAQIYGAELETTFIPIDPLKLEARFGWLDTKFLDFKDTVRRPIPGSPGEFFLLPLNFAGNPLPNAPKFKVSGSAQYTFEIGRLGTLIPRYDFSWTDDIAFDQSNGQGAPNGIGEIFLPRNAIGQNALLLHNIRLTYQNPSGDLEFAGWVRNLTNEVYKTLAFDASGGPAFVGNIIGDPRMYGLSLTTRF